LSILLLALHDLTRYHHQKLNNLRLEADHAIERAEVAEAKNKKLEQHLLEREQEITSLQHKLGVVEADMEKADGEIEKMKRQNMDQIGSQTTSEGLQRKVQLLEEELDAAEKNAKDTVEKSVITDIAGDDSDQGHLCLGSGR
jgi:tropomyosin